MDRDQLVPVPADRCFKNCTLLSTCYKFRGFAQPHVCLPWGGADATTYILLLSFAALLLAFVVGVVVYCAGGYAMKKYKKKHGGADFVELRRFDAVSDLTTI